MVALAVSSMLDEIRSEGYTVLRDGLSSRQVKKIREELARGTCSTVGNPRFSKSPDPPWVG